MTGRQRSEVPGLGIEPQSRQGHQESNSFLGVLRAFVANRLYPFVIRRFLFLLYSLSLADCQE
jgi:hypothetical protein